MIPATLLISLRSFLIFAMFAFILGVIFGIEIGDATHVLREVPKASE